MEAQFTIKLPAAATKHIFLHSDGKRGKTFTWDKRTATIATLKEGKNIQKKKKNEEMVKDTYYVRAEV